jgi:hypothetical protein
MDSSRSCRKCTERSSSRFEEFWEPLQHALEALLSVLKILTLINVLLNIHVSANMTATPSYKTENTSNSDQKENVNTQKTD